MLTIRFAAAEGSPQSVSRYFGTDIPAPAANDGESTRASDILLREALMHFAKSGLGAADAARAEAEAAFFAGDRRRYANWLGICRLLDARMARAIEARSDTALRKA